MPVADTGTSKSPLGRLNVALEPGVVLLEVRHDLLDPLLVGALVVQVVLGPCEQRQGYTLGIVLGEYGRSRVDIVHPPMAPAPPAWNRGRPARWRRSISCWSRRGRRKRTTAPAGRACVREDRKRIFLRRCRFRCRNSSNNPRSMPKYGHRYRQNPDHKNVFAENPVYSSKKLLRY